MILERSVIFGDLFFFGHLSAVGPIESVVVPVLMVKTGYAFIKRFASSEVITNLHSSLVNLLFKTGRDRTGKFRSVTIIVIMITWHQ